MRTTRKNSGKSTDDISQKRKRKPPRTIEDAENYNTKLAIELARKQLEEGTASSQVIVHYLKLGSSKEKIERDILLQQRELMAAKTGAIQSTQTSEELYSEAIKALRTYTGESSDDD